MTQVNSPKKLDGSTQPRARRLIVTAREARALREGATQVRRVIGVPELERALTLGRDVLVRTDDMLRLPLVVGGVYWIAEDFYCDDFEYPNGSRESMLRLMEYRASHDCRDWEAGCPCTPPDSRNRRNDWRSAATMPRWASRMSVVVEAVRVERVQDATEEDARACGWWDEFEVEVDVATFIRGGRIPPSTHYLGMKHHWDEEHPRAPWAANPWVALGVVRVQ